MCLLITVYYIASAIVGVDTADVGVTDTIQGNDDNTIKKIK